MLTQKMKQPFKTAQPVLFPPLADRAAWESLPGAAKRINQFSCKTIMSLLNNNKNSPSAR